MAGDWIKMRGALLQSPKLIGMSRHLIASQEFREWLIPGGSGPLNGQIVSDDALRCVTCALLLRVWSAAREFGKYDGDDLLLPHIELPDLDAMAGAPGVGEAMGAVQWAIEGQGVRLPNFKQHNVPMSNAERQRDYRRRLEEDADGVTKPLRASRYIRVTTEQNRREEEKDIKSVTRPAKNFVRPTLEEVRAYCQERQNSVNPEAWMDHYTANGWRVGRSGMKDWRAAVRQWERNNFQAKAPAVKLSAAEIVANVAAKFGSSS